MHLNLEELAFLSTNSGRLCLFTRQLETIIQTLKLKQPGIENLPVGISAVFGSIDVSYRKLFTDWLIHFHRNSGNQYKSTPINRTGNLEFIPAKLFLKTGVYYWPQFIEISSNVSCGRTLCLILYVEGDAAEFDEFLMMVCSQVVVFTEIDKEKLDKFKTATADWASKSVQCISMPNMGWVYGDNARDQQNAKLFFEALECHTIPPKTVSDGNLLLLKKLVYFLDWAAMKINDMHGKTVWGENPSPKFKTTDHTVVDMPVVAGKSNDPYQKNIHTIQPTIHTIGTHSTTHERNNWKDHPMEPSGMGRPTCPQYRETSIDLVEYQDIDWTEFVNIFLEELKNLLMRPAIYLKLQNFPASLEYLQKCNGKEYLNCFQKILELVCSYEQVLRNAFDNFICFHGDEDFKRLERLSDDAFTDVCTIDVGKNKVNDELLQKACSEIHMHYVSHNTQIAQYEMQLSLKIKERVIYQYTAILSEYHEKSLSTRNFEAVHGRMINKLISVISHCMDYDGRLSNVQILETNNLIGVLNSIYKEKRQSLLRFDEKHEDNTNQVLQAVKSYERIMRKVYKTPESFELETIHKHHTDNIKKVTGTIKNQDLLKEATDILQEHLAYILSLKDEQIQRTKSLPLEVAAQSKTLCLYITKHWIHSFMQTTTEILNIGYGAERLVKAPSLIALTKKSKLLYGYEAEGYIKDSVGDLLSFGNLDKYIENLIENEPQSRSMLTKFFKSIKASMEMTLRDVFSRVLILIPSWYGATIRKRIFECSSEAGFVETYLFRESSLISFKHIDTNSNLSPDSVTVAVIISQSGINVEMYGKSRLDKNVTQMLAFVSSPFPNQNTGNMKQKIWERFTGGNHNGNVDNVIPKNAKEILQNTYSKALSQIALQKIGQKYCFLLADSAEWQKIFDDLFKSLDDVDVVINERELAVEAAGLLSLDPQQTRNVIKDYVSVVLDSDIDSRPVLEKEAPRKLDNELCSTLNHQSNEIESKLATNKTEDILSKRKQLLSQKCLNMKFQIGNGEVKIRRLVQRLILETIKGAENAAACPEAKLEEIAYHENEIDELITEHNFKV